MFKINSLTAALGCSLCVVPAVWAQTVSGVVVNAQGEPLSGVEFSAGKKVVGITAADGQFHYQHQANNTFELHFDKAKFNHSSVQVAEGADLNALNIVLTPTVIETIDVYATPLHSSTIESALPVNVLAADELKLKQASTLGETLKNEVGVHSTYYGPVASSPIIRGLDGARVLVTQNGLDVSDASRVGPDHVVSSETSTARQIEVLRGPATLFYGSGAIGGVVNVVDNRVPTSSEQQLNFMVKHNTVADEDQASVDANFGTEQFAFHADAFWRQAGDYDIPGMAELEEHEEEHETEGKLENSSNKASGFTLGASYLLDNGFVGFSFGTMDRNYGVPGHGGHEEEENEEDHDEDEHEEEMAEEVLVRGDLEQERWQLLSELNFDQQFINKLATKVAYTDYQHQELEGDEVGTTFKNQLWEGRVDLYHQEYQGWKGAWTLHAKSNEFEAIGEEAFTPPYQANSFALAWLEEKHFGDWLVQLGARVEYVELSADIHLEEHEEEEHDELENAFAEEHEEIFSLKEDFTPVSFSAGAVWDYQPGYNLGLSLAFSQRAPSGSELFANGPHIGTNTYELGALYDLEPEGDAVHFELADRNADIETSVNFDVTWRKFHGDFGFIISGFYNQVKDYYFQQDSGFSTGVEDSHGHGGGEPLSIYVYRQQDADFYGFEAEFAYQVSPTMKVTVFGDYIRGKLSDDANLPRIPPMRLGGELNYQRDQYAFNVNLTHVFDQNDIAALETETEGYTLVDANFNYYIDGIGNDLVLFVKGENLTDEDARVHTSFLKNVSPLPGRGIAIGVRGSF